MNEDLAISAAGRGRSPKLAGCLRLRFSTGCALTVPSSNSTSRASSDVTATATGPSTLRLRGSRGQAPRRRLPPAPPEGANGTRQRPWWRSSTTCSAPPKAAAASWPPAGPSGVTLTSSYPATGSGVATTPSTSKWPAAMTATPPGRRAGSLSTRATPTSAGRCFTGPAPSGRSLITPRTST